MFGNLLLGNLLLGNLLRKMQLDLRVEAIVHQVQTNSIEPISCKLHLLVFSDQMLRMHRGSLQFLLLSKLRLRLTQCLMCHLAALSNRRSRLLRLHKHLVPQASPPTTKMLWGILTEIRTRWFPILLPSSTKVRIHHFRLLARTINNPSGNNSRITVVLLLVSRLWRATLLSATNQIKGHELMSNERCYVSVRFEVKLMNSMFQVKSMTQRVISSSRTKVPKINA